MVQDIPARKRIALLIITIALVTLSHSTTFAATTKKATAKPATPAKTSTKAKVATKTTATKKVVAKKPVVTAAKTQVKGEKVIANKVSVVGDNTITTYKVKSGDTLSGIAKKFDISVNTIRWSNGINSKGSIHVGQVLTILPTSGVIYIVKKGDTLSGIAVKFAADQDDILNANELESANSLKVGMKLTIPNTEPLDSAAAAAVTHDATTPTENISPITLPESSTADTTQAQTPTVTPPVVSTPVTQTPGTTMIVTNPVTSDTYSIITHPSSVTSYTISANNIRGYYAQPVSGRLSQGIHDVNAVDIATPIGTTVHAAAEGTAIVVKSDGKYNGGYGNYIVISHPNGTQTLYAHLSAATVALGDMVIQGQPIALSGNTGKVTGAHLHFEVRGGTNPWGSDPKGTTYSM